MTKRIVLFTACAGLLAGCATVPPEAGFPDVQQQVQARTGQRVQWRRDSREDAQVQQAVGEILGHELTPDAAVQIALLNNRRLQAAYEDLGVAQAAVVQAGLLNNPMFHFSAGFVVDGGQTELAFGVAQNFLEVFYIPLRKAVAEADFEATKLSVAGVVLDLAAQTRVAFYRASADEQLMEMRQQVTATTGASYDVAKKLHEAGNIRDLDLHNEKALYDQARLDLAIAQAAVAESRERLNRLLGLWGNETQWTIAHRLPPLPDEPLELDGLEAKAIDNSLDLAIARQEIVAFAHEFGLTKATSLLTFLEAGVEAEREEGEWNVGPSVALPIPLFDQGQARTAAAQAELRRRRQAYVATAVEIRSAVRAARQRLLTAQRAAVFYRDSILPLRDQIVRETLLEYNAMQLGVFQLLLVKEQQINAGQRYIETLRAYWVARTELETILQGRLTDVGREVPALMKAMPNAFGMTEAQGAH